MVSATGVVQAVASFVLLTACVSAWRRAAAAARPFGWRIALLMLGAALLRQALALGSPATGELASELLILLVAALAMVAVRFHSAVIADFVGSQQAIALRDALVAALADAAVELLTCPTADELWRRAVEFARERLGVRRCSIWLPTADPERIQGTFGTAFDGRTTDERGVARSVCAAWRAAAALQANDTHRYALSVGQPAELTPVGHRAAGAVSWVAATPIHAQGKLRAVLFNDAGLSGAAVDEAIQEALVVYTSLLGSLLERHEAQLERSSREQRLVQIMQLVGGVVYERDWSDDGYVLFSGDVERLTGLSVEEFTPRNFEARTEERVPSSDATLRTDLAASDGYPPDARHLYRADCRLRTADGEPRWLSDVALQFRDENGKLARSLGLLTDVTARRRLEQELREAQRLDALGKLAGGMAHDFSNLLTTVIGYAELADRELDSLPTARGHLRHTRQAAESAGELARQLLAFGQKQVMRPRRLDLNALLREAEPPLRQLAGGAVELRLELAETLPPVHADPEQIERVLGQLVANALEAMSEGGLLRLATGVADEAVELIVADTGCGMDEATCARIFEPCYSTKRRPGMGLATAYGVIAQSGGTIRVDSRPGHGSRFVIQLPALGQAGGDGVVVAERAPREGSVLLVEDNAGVRGLAELVLGAKGYRVTCAADAETAEELVLAGGEYDLLLADIMLPGRSGPELAERLRAGRPELPVLFISGYPADELDRRGYTPAPGEFLPKPFTVGDLAQRVAERLTPAA